MLQTAQTILTGAIGSFGLVITHSIDADGELVIAARGQTMSFAVYPRIGAVVFGSDASATKVGMPLKLSLA